MNHTDDDESASAFPRGSDVPFPLERPYPQQVHLMDAILHSLQQHQKQQQQQQQQQQVHSNDSPHQHRALVMMLESPTGTGKSLSLACAAMTWLRYMEQQDALETCDSHNNNSVENLKQQQQDNHDNKKQNNNDDTATTTATTTDWWNAWVPPEQFEEQHRDEQARKTALETRQTLTHELDLLRQKLIPSGCHDDDAKIAAAAPLGNSTNRHPGTKHSLNHRERRENLVRSAVTTAKMIEKQKAPKLKRPSKRVQQQRQIKDDVTMDYCVHDYHSDDDDEDDDCDSRHERNIDNLHKQPDAASRLETCLDGAFLDGSIQSKTTNTSTYCTAKGGGAKANKFTMGSVQPGSGVRKIYYAARTHSQLSQMVRELQRTAWGQTVRVVALGGRQLLCQNTSVNTKGRSETAISEACLDLQKNKSTSTTTATSTDDDDNNNNHNNEPKSNKKKRKSSTTGCGGSGCPFMASRSAVSTLALHLLAQPSDIEDAGRLGAASQTCAYYASRKSLAAAEVVLLPYNMLLSQQAREAVGLSLKGALIIIDEAHNLPEALRALHSSKVSLPIAEAALAQLIAYTDRYASRLAGRNLHYLGQMRRILLAFNQYLKRNGHDTNTNRPALMSPEELLLELKLDHINLFKILRYLKNSRLSQKLLGFVHQTTIAASTDTTPGDNNNNTVDSRLVSKHVSAMAPVQSFLEKLIMTSGEGKIVTDWPSTSGEPNRVSHPTLRYVLLQPAAHFDHILQEAHAVALVGGTLRPFAHMAAELLSSDKDEQLLKEAKAADERLEKQQRPELHQSSTPNSSCSTTLVANRWTAFTCDHVVPASNVRLECIGTGPTNFQLDFRHNSRASHATCDELARVLIQTCRNVPAGVVVFVPSYSYEALLVQRWKLTGSWQELSKYKRVHREPKSSQQVEETLTAYAKDAKNHGALLLSVIGGKMSEGINFADHMARCVVVVGLPYPDCTDPVLKEKMNLLDQHSHPSQKNGPAASGKAQTSMITGQSYYQNLCLRAINQSVGRAIRHAKDYAAILLCDVRYTTDERIWLGLPQWLRRSGGGRGPRTSFSSAMNRLELFFQEMANNEGAELSDRSV